MLALAALEVLSQVLEDFMALTLNLAVVVLLIIVDLLILRDKRVFVLAGSTA
jgi:predicted transcriptional regulator